MKTTLIFTITLFTLSLFTILPHSDAENSTRWVFPEVVVVNMGKGNIDEITYSPDGNLLAVTGSHGIWLCDANTGKEQAYLTGHTRSVNSVAFSPDSKSKMLASGSDDGMVRLWNIDTKTEIATLRGHTDVNSVAFSRDGETLTSGDSIKTVLWKIPPYLDIGDPTLPSTDSNANGEMNIQNLPVKTFNVDLNGDGVVSLEEDYYVMEFISENDLFLAADVNKNDKVDGDDDDIVVEILNGREPFEAGNVNPSADVNKDGKVTVTDLQLVRFALKLDVNSDGLINGRDVNDIAVAINVSDASLKYDVNGDGVVNDQDQFLVNTIVKDTLNSACLECPFPEILISDVAFTPNYTFFVLHPQFVTFSDANPEDYPFKYTITLSQESREPLPHFMFPLELSEPKGDSTHYLKVGASAS